MVEPRYISLGDSALTVEFGNAISTELNDLAVALSDRLIEAPFTGFVETVPAYASCTVFYRPALVLRAFPTSRSAYSTVQKLVEKALKSLGSTVRLDNEIIEIPVTFGGEDGPDLEFVAEKSGLSQRKVIDIFAGRTYRVFMLGFLPGFSYMGEVDELIAVPRKDNPRTDVRPGSVGIAGRQTGIYSLPSPGGWQIIGRTAIEMFTPDNPSPCYLGPGNNVRFVPTK
jgi:inhibitor of KinA